MVELGGIRRGKYASLLIRNHLIFFREFHYNFLDKLLIKVSKNDTTIVRDSQAKNHHLLNIFNIFILKNKFSNLKSYLNFTVYR